MQFHLGHWLKAHLFLVSTQPKQPGNYYPGKGMNHIGCKILLLKDIGLESTGVGRLVIKGFASRGSKLNKGSEWMRMMTSNVWSLKYRCFFGTEFQSLRVKERRFFHTNENLEE